ncbi:acetone carboxylase subunit gamma [Kyrpidia spormannii]|uniref:Acetone carboxylase subunit gamma n=1 Tax=Kyrpidia spormannii TaxID=2055160 RepID=A0A2K8N9K8_9BACL|nr:acetone carboxylase subunit gamma [Kyrpidia spormannii]ATY85300.1 acetone carboxylase subunit gamma [Kyrpidia spormannii]
MAVSREKIQRIADMLEGRISTQELFRVIAGQKDPEAFDALVAYFQEKVPWTERVILPLSDHLCIVSKTEGTKKKAIVKCTCGYEFEDYRVNWKVKARVYVRESSEEFHEIYPQYMHAEPGWQVLREYYCPGCLTLLEVEAVPVGYPPTFDALPDIQTLYRDWLGRELPVDEHTFGDLTADYVKTHFTVNH